MTANKIVNNATGPEDREIVIDRTAGTITYSHKNVGALKLDNEVSEYEVPGYITLRENSENSGNLSHSRIRVQTFGNFNISIDGVPVAFSTEKADEFLAILVDARGYWVTNDKMISMLYEKEHISGSATTLDTRFRQLKNKVKKELLRYDISFIIDDEPRGKQRIISHNIRCDLYDYLTLGDNSPVQYQGVYMLDYEWADRTATAVKLDESYRNYK